MSWMSTDTLAKIGEDPKAIFAIDFDGTIVENEYPRIGRPVPMALEVLKELTAKKYRLILYTMRSEKELNEAVVYCNRNNLDFWGINENPEQSKWTTSPKIYANVYFDDAGAGTPLLQGGNGKPYVDWVKVREMLVDWGILEAKDVVDDGTKTFEI